MSTERARAAEVFVEGLRFGEGPRWHDGRLWYSDFYDHAVYSLDEAGERRRELALDPPGQPSGLGWLPDGRLLVVSMLDRRVLRLEPDGKLVPHADLAPFATWHANDMVVSVEGRAYVGNFGFDLDAVRSGELRRSSITTTSLVRVDLDGNTTEVATDLAFPNGTVIFPDQKTLVVSESMGFRMTAFDIAEDGSLENRRVWAELGGVAPDGCCLDAEGCIWVANALGREALRAAEGGEVVDRVATGDLCYACMLGGADRRTLYCTTAPSSLAREVRDKRAGRIVRARVDVEGAGLP